MKKQQKNRALSELTGEAKAIHEQMESYQNDHRDFTGWGWTLTYSSNGAFSKLNDYIKNEQILLDKYVGILSNTMGEMQKILDYKLLDVYMNIILGSPIETFDEFVIDWKNLGGDQITEEINQFYKELEENQIK